MAFQISPGVLVQEKDLTRVIPAVSTSVGAIAMETSKGPVEEIVTVANESELVQYFGQPNDSNFEDWFAASSFLQYSNALRVVRTSNTGLLNATANGSGLLIKNYTDWKENYSAGQASVGIFAAKTAGTWGNSLTTYTCSTATGYQQDAITTVNDAATAVGDKNIVLTSASNIGVGDVLEFSSSAAGTDYDGYLYDVISIATNTVTIKRHQDGDYGLQKTVTNGANVRRRWKYYDQVNGAPGTSPYAADKNGSNDEIHVVIVDEKGYLTGTAGSILESYSKLSKAIDAKTPQGDNNYYAYVLGDHSQYVYWLDHPSNPGNWGQTAFNNDFNSASVANTTSTLGGGSAGSAATEGQHKSALELFLDKETVDIGLLISGQISSLIEVDNIISIAENRNDCLAFVSPRRSDVVNIGNTNTQLTNVLSFYSSMRSSSFVVADSGYKYMYDRYADTYRWVPLNGDIAGLCARTDLVADAWYSPAGYNRGGIRGAVKLAFNPTQDQRDDLYRSRINPVVNFPGQGVVLFGDKTGLTSPSAFDRINVRRLFIILEKAISTAAKFQLFEFNDEFTRANFRNIVEPFLREVQGRKGITDFKVICDETNNTGEVIDRNEFIAQIYVKPARSINFITLQFIATRSGVSFSEVVG
jgi:phage tail sheath protein FI